MKTIVVFFFIGLLSLSVIGQEVKPLNFLITKESKQGCFGGIVNVVTKLTNNSNAPIAIDTNRIVYSVNYSWSASTSGRNAGGSFNSISDIGSNYKPVFIILKPSESYSKRITLPINNEAFSQTGKYTIQLVYGQFLETQFKDISVWQGAVESNEINTLIKKCK